jgi:hypothetical protein
VVECLCKALGSKSSTIKKINEWFSLTWYYYHFELDLFLEGETCALQGVSIISVCKPLDVSCSARPLYPQLWQQNYFQTLPNVAWGHQTTSSWESPIYTELNTLHLQQICNDLYWIKWKFGSCLQLLGIRTSWSLLTNGVKEIVLSVFILFCIIHDA